MTPRTAESAITEAQIMETVERCLRMGTVAAMTATEIEKGYTPIRVGEADWLPVKDWQDNAIVSMDGRKVRIVAVIAKEQGRGAFSRLVTNIIKSGLQPVVVCPFSQMESILERWNWRKKIVGSTYEDVEEQWFPMRKFVESRRAQ